LWLSLSKERQGRVNQETPFSNGKMS
jgi:hypothetical protein